MSPEAFRLRTKLHTLDAPIRELAGKVHANQEEAERLHEAMKHVEAVIKLLTRRTI